MCSDSKNYEEQRKKEKEEEDKRRNKIKEDRRRFEEKREKEYKEQRRVEVESRAKANAEEDQRRAKLEEERKESEEKRDQEYEARKKLKQEERRKKKEEDELREAESEERRRKFDEMQHLQFQELLLRKFEWALREDKYYYSSSESEEDDDEYLLEEYTLNADAHHGEGTVENGIPATSDVEIIEKQNGEIIENIISAKPNVENIVNIDPVNIDIDCEEYEMNIEKTLLENQSKNKDVETMPNNGKYFTDCIVKSISDQEIHIERICYEVKDSESNGDSGRLQNKSKVDFDCAQYSDSEILQYDFGVGPSGTESLEKDSRVDSEGYQMQGDRTIYQDRDNEPNLLITDSEYHQRKQSVCVRYTGRHEMKSNQRRDKMNETDGHRSQDHEIYSGREDNFKQGKQVKSILLKKRKQINILDEISKFKVPRTETRNATTDKIMSRLENSQYRRDLCAVSSVENVSRSPYQCYESENVQYMGKHQMISWKSYMQPMYGYNSQIQSRVINPLNLVRPSTAPVYIGYSLQCRSYNECSNGLHNAYNGQLRLHQGNPAYFLLTNPTKTPPSPQENHQVKSQVVVFKNC